MVSGNHHENKIRITNFEPEEKLSLQWKAEKEENIIESLPFQKKKKIASKKNKQKEDIRYNMKVPN